MYSTLATLALVGAVAGATNHDDVRKTDIDRIIAIPDVKWKVLSTSFIVVWTSIHASFVLLHFTFSVGRRA